MSKAVVGGVSAEFAGNGPGGGVLTYDRQFDFGDVGQHSALVAKSGRDSHTARSTGRFGSGASGGTASGLH